MVQTWCDDTPTQYEGICFLYVKFLLYTQPWAIPLGVKIITLSETKICIPITFIWELPPLSGADTERHGDKLHVHVVVSMVDETTLLAVALIVAMAKGTGMNGKKKGWKISRTRSPKTTIPDYCKADLKQRVLSFITIFRLAIPKYCYKKQYTLF